MRVLVTVKRVIDPYAKIRLKKDGTGGVETQNMKMCMNPFDEIALEQAVRLREKGLISEIVVITIGTAASQETLRHALAIGADKAVLIQTEAILNSFEIASVIKTWMADQSFDLILMGKQTIDGDNNQTPQILAGLLDWPQATFASELTIENNAIEVVREVDSGLETLAITLPAVISADLRLNEPRYVSLPNIMQAKRKPLTSLELTELPITLSPQTRVLSIKAPSVRSKGVMVDSVVSLVDKLRHEAKVLKEEAV